jgi:hypothetical protein
VAPGGGAAAGLARDPPELLLFTGFVVDHQ